MEASTGVKDSSAMMQFEWKVSDIVFKKSVLIATELLKFGNTATLQFGIKNCRYNEEFHTTTLEMYAVAHNFHQVGIVVKKIFCTVYEPLENRRRHNGKLRLKRKYSGDNLFTGKFDEYQPFQGGSTFSVSLNFCLCLGATTPNFSYRLRDDIFKMDMWTAAEKCLFTDVEFVVQKSYRVAAHRCLVALRSPVLAAICRNHSPLVDVYIDDVRPDIFQQLLYFIYTGQLLQACDHQLLWIAAEKYQVETLKELCRNAEPIQHPDDLLRFLKTIPLEQVDTTKRDVTMEYPLLLEGIILEFNCTWRPASELLPRKWNLRTDDQISFTATVKRFWKESSRVMELRFDSNRLNNQLLPVDVNCFINSSDQSLSLKHDANQSTGFRSSQRFANTFLNLENCSHRPIRLTFYVHVRCCVDHFNYQFFDSLMETQLWAAARDRVLTDVEFIVGEEVIAAHRPIIAARCPILASRIAAADYQVDPSESVDTSNWRSVGESASHQVNPHSRRVTITDVDASVFEQLLYFLYTGTLKDAVEDNVHLYEAAEQFQVETLILICCSQQRDNVAAYITINSSSGEIK